MTLSIRRACRPAWIALPLLICPHAARAQADPPPFVSLGAGQMHYDLGGLRNGTLIALRLGSPLVPLGQRHWLVEPGITYGWYQNAGGQHLHLFLPELQLQFQYVGGPVAPYIGAGGGFGLTRVDTVSSTYWTASAAGGVRLRLGAGWGLAGELRLRTISLFTSRTTELTLALVRRME